MRLLYAGIGVIGGVLGLVATYFYLIFWAFMGGENTSVGNVGFGAVVAFLLAALLNLVAGFMDPRAALPRRLLLASAAIWPIGALVLAAVGYIARPDLGLLDAVRFMGIVAAPAILPLAAWAFARWQFPLQ